METTIKKFNTLHEYNQYLEAGETLECFKHRAESHDFYLGDDRYSKKRKKWVGTQSWNEATDLMIHGDKALAKKVEKEGVATARVKVNAVRPRAKVVRSVGGFMPNIPAYLADSKKQMFRIQKQPVKQRVMTIVYNASVYCGTDADEVVETSSKLVQTIMKIEASGTRVNLYMANLTASNLIRDWKNDTPHKVVGALVKIKDSGQYMDVLKMCYPLIHPSMHRRQHFRLLEMDSDNDYTSCYGYPVQYGKAVDEVVKESGIKNATVISFYEINGKSLEEISKIITSK